MQGYPLLPIVYPQWYSNGQDASNRAPDRAATAFGGISMR